MRLCRASGEWSKSRNSVEICRESDSSRLSQDVFCAIRTLKKRPGFTCVAVLTLALGIGANTAIFSVVSSVLLRPLPYKDPSRLVYLWEQSEESAMSVAFPNFKDYRSQSVAFESLAA